MQVEDSFGRHILPRQLAFGKDILTSLDSQAVIWGTLTPQDTNKLDSSFVICSKIVHTCNHT